MVEVRNARRSDRQAIRDLHVESVRELAPAAYREAVVDAWVGDEERDPANYEVTADESAFFVADVEGDVVGFGEIVSREGATSAYDMAADAEVRAVYVAPDWAGDGIGSALLAELESWGRERDLKTVVLTASLNAVDFYEARGYEQVRERTHTFGGEVEGPVVVMRKSL